MKVLVALLVLGVATIAMAATLGMDVSQPTSTKTFQCFVASGYTFAGIRVSILSSSSFN
jgi:Tfp pilus assembly protein PilV